jgi:hypothetical protein
MKINEMTTKHTPGPWEWIGDDYDPYGKWGWKELAPNVINGTVEGQISVDDANAHLIAAAPLLYEELHTLVNVLKLTAFKYENQAEALEKVLANANAALAKATGEREIL